MLTLQTCLSTKSYDVALEALQRAHELGLQFDNNDAYYKLMKVAITNGRLDIATRYAPIHLHMCCWCVMCSTPASK